MKINDHLHPRATAVFRERLGSDLHPPTAGGGNRHTRESCLATLVRLLGLSAATRGFAQPTGPVPAGPRPPQPLPPIVPNPNVSAELSPTSFRPARRLHADTSYNTAASRYQLVVACCEATNQSLAWLDEVPSWWEVFIYHSRPHTGDRAVRQQATEIMLEESSDLPHVVGTHLATFYRQGIAEYTVFAPGDAMYHSPYFADLLSRPDTLQPVQAMSLRTDETHPPHAFIRDAPTSGNVRIENTSTRTLEAVHYKGDGFVAAKSYRRYYQLAEGQNLISFFFSTIGLPQWIAASDDLIPSAHAGMIGVSRSAVKRHLPSVYRGLRDKTVESEVVVPIAQAGLMTLFGGRDLELAAQRGLRHRRGRTHNKLSEPQNRADSFPIRDQAESVSKEKRL